MFCWLFSFKKAMNAKKILNKQFWITSFLRYAHFQNFHILSPRIQWESKIIWFYCISWCWPMISSSLPFLWDFIWKKVRWRSSFYKHAFIDQSSHRIVAEAIIVRGLVWFAKRWAFKICLLIQPQMTQYIMVEMWFFQSWFHLLSWTMK